MNGKKKSRKSFTGGGDTTRSRSRGNEKVAPTSPSATVDVGDVDSITPILRGNTATAQVGTQRNASLPNVKGNRSSSRDENHDTTSKHDEGNGNTPPNGDTASQATLNVDATSTQRCEPREDPLLTMLRARFGEFEAANLCNGLDQNLRREMLATMDQMLATIRDQLETLTSRTSELESINRDVQVLRSDVNLLMEELTKAKLEREQSQKTAQSAP